MHLDPAIALAGLFIGFIVGLTGMGGGALMTPVLVLVFHVDALVAVSSDVVASLFMKPVGALVHARRHTVHTGLVRWLAAGSVPGALAGVLLLRVFDADAAKTWLRPALGVALVLAALSVTVKSWLDSRRGPVEGEVVVRRAPTLAIGVLGGLVVGITSVGSGSLMIVLLLALYPTLSPSSLVGTDLAQAVPLVAAAALGHALLGDVKLALTASVLVGALPGVYVGARVSAEGAPRIVRPALVVVLLASGMQLLRV